MIFTDAFRSDWQQAAAFIVRKQLRTDQTAAGTGEDISAVMCFRARLHHRRTRHRHRKIERRAQFSDETSTLTVG
jgi:hypothetical protein